jgi:hypothetical protein
MSTAGEISGRKGPLYYSEPRSHERDARDFYVEPEWAVELLLNVEPFAGWIFDPFAGSGTIVRVAKRHGLMAEGSDLEPRGDGIERADFFETTRRRSNFVFNPPYKGAERAIRHALSLAMLKVAVLVQSKFPYSQTRHRLFTELPPARIYFLSSRPSMPPGEKLLAGTVEAKGGKLDYCWIVWSKDRTDITTAHWLKRGAQ